MRRPPALLAAAVATGLLAWAGGPPPSPAVLDERTADYLEDAAVPRPVAAVRAVLCGQGDRRWLELEVTALGPRVAPLPGLAGAPGSNLRTAQELHDLLGEGAMSFALRRGGSATPGELVAVTRDNLPVRRLCADGTLDEHARSAARLPVTVRYRSPALPAQDPAARCYLVARGVPRLLVEVDLVADRIVAVDSLAEGSDR